MELLFKQSCSSRLRQFVVVAAAVGAVVFAAAGAIVVVVFAAVAAVVVVGVAAIAAVFSRFFVPEIDRCQEDDRATN